MTQESKPRGGYRPNSGRKPVPEGERKQPITFYATPAERALILARGGADYLRRLIAADTRGEER